MEQCSESSERCLESRKAENLSELSKVYCCIWKSPKSLCFLLISDRVCELFYVPYNAYVVSLKQVHHVH